MIIEQVYILWALRSPEGRKVLMCGGKANIRSRLSTLLYAGHEMKISTLHTTGLFLNQEVAIETNS